MSRSDLRDQYSDPLSVERDLKAVPGEQNRSDGQSACATTYEPIGGSQQDSLERTKGDSVEPRKAYEFRGQTYSLRASEFLTLAELGKFRTVAAEDLQELAYRGDGDRMRPDLQNLIQQGLISRRTIPQSETGPRHLLTLTKRGHHLLASTGNTPRNQLIHYGFVKPREMDHDADLYRLYYKAAEKIERDGGKNLRVILDYELKQRVCRDLAKLGPGKHSAEQKRDIADRHGLEVVRGKIPLPDLRIEYETLAGEIARADFELATEHYRGRSLVEKARAGFSLYARAQDAPGLRRVLEQRELTAEILSL